MDTSFKSMLIHARHYLSANIAIKAAGVLYIPILTRLLNPIEYGTYAIYNSWILYLTIFATCNFSAPISRYYYEKKDDFKEFFATTVLLTFSFYIPFFIIFISFQDSIANLLGLPKNTIVLLLISILLAVSIQLYDDILQAQRNSLKLSRLSISRIVLSMLITLYLAFYTNTEKYITPILGSIIGNGLFFVYYGYKLSGYFVLNIKKAHIIYIIAFALPMMVNTVGVLMLQNSDIIIIGKLENKSTAGIYKISYQIGALILMVNGAINRSWIPIFYKYMNEKKYSYHDIDVKKQCWMIMSVSIVFIFSGKYIGILLVPETYLDAISIIPIIVLGYYFHQIHEIYRRYLMFERKFNYVLISPFIAGVTNIILNIIFIPVYGYKVASLTILFAFIIQMVVVYIIVKRIVDIPIVSMRGLISPSMLLLVIVILKLCLDYFDIIYIVDVLIVSIFVGIYLFKREKICI